MDVTEKNTHTQTQTTLISYTPKKEHSYFKQWKTTSTEKLQGKYWYTETQSIWMHQYVPTECATDLAACTGVVKNMQELTQQISFFTKTKKRIERKPMWEQYEESDLRKQRLLEQDLLQEEVLQIIQQKSTQQHQT